MFWRKKQVAVAPVTASGTTAAPGGVIPPLTQASVPLKQKIEKLPGPQDIPELAGRHLVVAKERDPDWVWHLKVVVRKNPGRGKKAFDVRVFDEAQAAQNKVKIKDWTTFDEHPGLVLYEGWFDKESMRAELEERKQEEKTASAV